MQTKIVNQQQQTPLEKLLADKCRIQKSCQQKETHINETFIYIQENASSLLLSGLTSLLFSKTPKEHEGTTNSTITNRTDGQLKAGNPTLNISDFFSVGKALLPVAWNFIQPIAIGWCVRNIKKRITNLFFGSKKQKIKHDKN